MPIDFNINQELLDVPSDIANIWITYHFKINAYIKEEVTNTMATYLENSNYYKYGFK